MFFLFLNLYFYSMYKQNIISKYWFWSPNNITLQEDLYINPKF